MWIYNKNNLIYFYLKLQIINFFKNINHKVANLL